MNHLDEKFDESKYIVTHYCTICKNSFCKYCLNSKNCTNLFGEHFLIKIGKIFELAKKDENLIANYEKDYIDILNQKQNEFFSFDQKSQITLKNIYNLNKNINQKIFELGKKVIKTFIFLKSTKNFYLYQNYNNFSEFNYSNYNEKKFEKRTIYYKTNYIFNFKKIEVYKVIYQTEIESIYNVISYIKKRYIIIFCKIKENHVFFFIDERGKMFSKCISLTNVEKLTSIIITSNDLLIFGYSQKNTNKGKIKIYNLIDFLEKQKETYYSNVAHLTEVLELCEMDKNILLTVGVDDFKIWNINGEPICKKTLYESKIQNILKCDTNKFFFSEKQKVFCYDYELSIKNKLKIFHFDYISSMNLFYKENKNKLLLTAGYDHRIVLWDINSLKNIKKLFEIELENKIEKINIFNNFICCELINKRNEFILLNKENKFLKRIFYYHLFNSKLSKFTQFSEHRIKNKVFAVTNDNNKFGFAIFQSISDIECIVDDITFC
jgi:WD40 repeat protein